MLSVVLAPVLALSRLKRVNSSMFGPLYFSLSKLFLSFVHRIKHPFP